tara:strand:- start:14902 stop:15240 length:339 start_codon:yes stop_codon:yes gene_type:complete
MATKRENETFTMWTHIENGRHMPRRIHRMEIVVNGRTHMIEGDNLPDVMVTDCGQARKGTHLATLLLNSKKKEVFVPSLAQPWPLGRDFLHILIGFVGFVMFRFFILLLLDV